MTTCGSCAHFAPHASIHGEYGDCALHGYVTTADLRCDDRSPACSTNPSPHHPSVQL